MIYNTKMQENKKFAEENSSNRKEIKKIDSKKIYNPIFIDVTVHVFVCQWLKFERSKGEFWRFINPS